jgi:hypothetical protein
LKIAGFGMDELSVAARPDITSFGVMLIYVILDWLKRFEAGLKLPLKAHIRQLAQ